MVSINKNVECNDSPSCFRFLNDSDELYNAVKVNEYAIEAVTDANNTDDLICLRAIFEANRTATLSYAIYLMKTTSMFIASMLYTGYWDSCMSLQRNEMQKRMWNTWMFSHCIRRRISLWSQGEYAK